MATTKRMPTPSHQLLGQQGKRGDTRLRLEKLLSGRPNAKSELANSSGSLCLAVVESAFISAEGL